MALNRPLIAGATRSHPAEVENGDAWAVSECAGVFRIALIDALGHGPVAAAVARRGLAALSAYPEAAPGESLLLCHDALKGTRGAALSVATIDCERSELRFAGIGNVEARLQVATASARPVAYRGIVGGPIPRPREFAFTLAEPWLLLLYSDGIRARFELPDAAALAGADVSAWVENLVREWARVTDDATAVLAAGF